MQKGFRTALLITLIFRLGLDSVVQPLFANEISIHSGVSANTLLADQAILQNSFTSKLVESAERFRTISKVGAFSLRTLISSERTLMTLRPHIFVKRWDLRVEKDIRHLLEVLCRETKTTTTEIDAMLTGQADLLDVLSALDMDMVDSPEWLQLEPAQKEQFIFLENGMNGETDLWLEELIDDNLDTRNTPLVMRLPVHIDGELQWKSFVSIHVLEFIREHNADGNELITDILQYELLEHEKGSHAQLVVYLNQTNQLPFHERLQRRIIDTFSNVAGSVISEAFEGITILQESLSAGISRNIQRVTPMDFEVAKQQLEHTELTNEITERMETIRRLAVLIHRWSKRLLPGVFIPNPLLVSHLSAEGYLESPQTIHLKEGIENYYFRLTGKGSKHDLAITRYWFAPLGLKSFNDALLSILPRALMDAKHNNSWNPFRYLWGKLHLHVWSNNPFLYLPSDAFSVSQRNFVYISPTLNERQTKAAGVYLFTKRLLQNFLIIRPGQQTTQQDTVFAFAQMGLSLHEQSALDDISRLKMDDWKTGELFSYPHAFQTSYTIVENAIQKGMLPDHYWPELEEALLPLEKLASKEIVLGAAYAAEALAIAHQQCAKTGLNPYDAAVMLLQLEWDPSRINQSHMEVMRELWPSIQLLFPNSEASTKRQKNAAHLRSYLQQKFELFYALSNTQDGVAFLPISFKDSLDRLQASWKTALTDLQFTSHDPELNDEQHQLQAQLIHEWSLFGASPLSTKAFKQEAERSLQLIFNARHYEMSAQNIADMEKGVFRIVSGTTMIEWLIQIHNELKPSPHRSHILIHTVTTFLSLMSSGESSVLFKNNVMERDTDGREGSLIYLAPFLSPELFGAMAAARYEQLHEYQNKVRNRANDYFYLFTLDPKEIALFLILLSANQSLDALTNSSLGGMDNAQFKRWHQLLTNSSRLFSGAPLIGFQDTLDELTLDWFETAQEEITQKAKINAPDPASIAAEALHIAYAFVHELELHLPHQAAHWLALKYLDFYPFENNQATRAEKFLEVFQNFLTHAKTLVTEWNQLHPPTAHTTLATA